MEINEDLDSGSDVIAANDRMWLFRPLMDTIAPFKMALNSSRMGCRQAAMNEYEQRLFDHTATTENGAAFSAAREGSLARVRPLTPRAIAWLWTHVPEHEDTTRYGDDMIVELRYFPALAEAIIAAGFTFERDALPN